MKLKISFFVTALLLLFACTQKEPPKTTIVGMYTPYYRNPISYNGQLKELTLMVHFAEEKGDIIYPGAILTDAEIDSLGLIGHTKITFDPDGNVLSSAYINSEGMVKEIYEIEYKDGIMVGATYSNGESELFRRDFVKKYENDIPSEVEVNNLVNGNKYYFDFTFNVAGQYLKMDQSDSEGNPMTSRSYLWDEKMQLKEYTVRNRTGQVNYISKYKYIPGDNTVDLEVYDGNDSLLLKQLTKEIESDEMGNPIGKVFYNDGKLRFYDVLTYVYY